MRITIFKVEKKKKISHSQSSTHLNDQRYTTTYSLMTTTYIPNIGEAMAQNYVLTCPPCHFPFSTQQTTQSKQVTTPPQNDYLPSSSQSDNDLESWPLSPWSSDINQTMVQTKFEDYLKCPPLSPDLYTPISTEAMNYFEASFKAAASPNCYTPISTSTSTSTSPLGNLQGNDSFLPAGQNLWEKQTSPHLFHFSPSPTLDEEDTNMGQEGIDPTLSQIFIPRLPSPISESFPDMGPIVLPSKRNSAIPKTKSSPQHPPTNRRSSRPKSQQKKPSSLQLINSSGMKKSKLPSPPPYTPTSPNPSPSTKSNTPPSRKTTHNLCEKKYRNRLNGEFSKLLNTLPREIVAAETSSPFGDPYGQEDEKRIGKAETLILAKNYIENLERENEGLEKDCIFLGQHLDSIGGNIT